MVRKVKSKVTKAISKCAQMLEIISYPKIACATMKSKDIAKNEYDINGVMAWRLLHFVARLTLCANFKYFREFSCALE